MTENEIGTVIVNAAIAVHRQLGPGLLESVYEIVLAYELQKRGCLRKSADANPDPPSRYDL
jgi:GxxExxY protein